MALSASPAVDASAVDASRFRAAVWVWLLLVVVFTLGLVPVLSASARESVSGLGLLTAGLAATASGIRRARRSRGMARRPWVLFVVAGLVAIAGNAWVTATGVDPSKSPSLVSDGSIAVALLISIWGVLSFPSDRRRGAELVVMVLDGLVTGGAFLLIVSVLVYSELLDSPTSYGAAAEAFAVLVPVLDVLLATVAVLLVVRALRVDRLMLVLVAAGFLLYASSDLAFAVQSAKGDFHFGSVLDMGWIAGYLTLGLATWVPTESAETGGGRAEGEVSDAFGAILVFAVLAVAAVVELAFGKGTGRLIHAQAALLVTLIGVAGVRQVLLTSDNASLRRGLERRVAEQTAGLRSLARQNEVLVTSVGDGVYGVDKDGRVTFINPSALEVLGYSIADLTGRRAHETFHAPDKDGAPFPWAGCYVHEAITHGVVASAEEDEYVRADGSVFPVEITASPLMDEDEVRGAVVVFRDVTQRREIERMKNEFLSVVSHELRTPLTSIRGSLGLLAGGRLGEMPPKAESLIGIALKSSERLTRLINDLLDVERLESGVKTLVVVPFTARDLLESAARQVEGMATSQGVRIEVDAMSSGRVLADEDQIIQTLINLLGNAVKFSDPGSRVWLDAQPHGSDEVLFRVGDEGRGIPPDKVESIFERFQQVDSSDTRQKGGTGLGLTISRGIVNRHGGRIWVESELGSGTVVHFTLPAAAVPTAVGESVPPDSPLILLCDDDQAIVDSFSALLRAHGYRTICATDGEQALRLAASEQPAVVLLDLLMPGATGAQVVEGLHGRATTHSIPIVVISGLAPESNDEVARSTEGWLIKPVSEERLVQAVSMAVSGRPPGASVLLVEDDEELAGVIHAMLTQAGLQVMHAASAAQAVVRGQELQPDVIVLDLRLPDGDGSDVVDEFNRRGSLADTPLVIYTAAEVDDGHRPDLHLGPTVFLTKGRTSPEELRDQVLSLVRAVTSVPVPSLPSTTSPAEGGSDVTSTR